MPPEEVFKEPFVDHDRFIELGGSLEAVAAGDDPARVSEAVQCLAILNSITASLSGSPVRPPDDELCRRFSQGSLDARTVLCLTGWTADRLYDACSELGLTLPTDS